MLDLFEQEESAALFIDKIMEKYKRYDRGQFMLLEKSIRTYPQEQRAALDHCIKNELWSATDFRDVATYLSQHNLGDLPKRRGPTTSTVSSDIQVSTRSIDEYDKILGGEMNE